MVKLKIIALFFGLLMTLQMLPIAEIGKMISTNQWVEEMPHNTIDNSKVEYNAEPHFLPPAMNPYVALFADSKIVVYLHCLDLIFTNHFSDVVSPPPDFLS